jgi:hypothetical protein
MSELTTFDDMTIEAIEVACQSAFEECESVFRAIDSKKNQLEIFGRLLTAAKKKVAHGEWENWLTDTFGGRLKLRTAQLWMSKAQKVALLDSDEKPRIVPRAERKTGRVDVQPVADTADKHPLMNCDKCGQLRGHGHTCDLDPTPAPRTNVLHKPATAKVKEADRPVPAAVTPEFINEPVPATTDGMMVFYKDDHAGILAACLECVPRQLMFDAVIERYAPVLLLRCLDTLRPGEVKAAKVLREAADKIDPRKSAKQASTPSAQELIDLIPDDWIDIRKDAAARWARSKQARPLAQRIPDTEAWQIVLEQMSKHEPNSLLEKVKNAHVGNWKGWNHDSKTGNANGSGKVTTGRIKPAADEPKITWV